MRWPVLFVVDRDGIQSLRHGDWYSQRKAVGSDSLQRTNTALMTDVAMTFDSVQTHTAPVLRQSPTEEAHKPSKMHLIPENK